MIAGNWKSSEHRLKRIYYAMKRRCYNKTDEAYKYYGARGITICDEWLDESNGYITFKQWALSNGYTDELTIDRIDVNKDYCPDNCRWVTMKIQLNNTRRNKLVTYNGETKTVSNWCDELGLQYEVVYNRIFRYHWTPKRALETRENPSYVKLTYKGETKYLKDWASQLGMKNQTLYGRIFVKNWSVERALETVPKKRRYSITYNGTTKTIREWAECLGITYAAITHKLSRGWSIEEIVNSVKGERK